MNFDEISVHSSAEESPGFLLWRVSTLWRKAIEMVLKPLDLTHPQFVILATVGYLTKDKEKVSQADIGRHAALDPNTTSQILRGLEAKELIERSFVLDERSKSPRLTQKGKVKLAKALPAVEKADEEFFATVDLRKSSMLKALQLLS
ncbi:MAG: MarR family transcriptional regulator [Rhabdochlamydiaceae bacterium]|nr:MarR family transcriptional regulator [Rhabdochlamydiaceae bacterium]